METQIFVLKQDIIDLFKDKVKKKNLKCIQSLIEKTPILKNTYIDVSYAYEMLDFLDDENMLIADYNLVCDELEKLPTTRFIKNYDTEILLKEDVIAAFQEVYQREQIMPESPDYELIMDIINSIPVARLEV